MPDPFLAKYPIRVAANEILASLKLDTGVGYYGRRDARGNGKLAKAE
jgi:hypothetical protein